MITAKAKKRTYLLTALLFLGCAIGVVLPSTAYAGAVDANYFWESGDISDPANVEPISGSNFAAYNAFNNWSQTQSVSSGAGVSGVVGVSGTAFVPYTSAEIRVGNVQSSQMSGITVTAGSYIAFAFTNVGADVSLSNISADVNSTHLSYTETNSGSHTGFVVVYFKLESFTIAYGTTNTTKLADINFGTNSNVESFTITHHDLMGEPDPGGDNVYVSSGLLDSTPEIPPAAIPAVYTGLGLSLVKLRARFNKKKKGSEVR
jgi:hypothetical protein